MPHSQQRHAYKNNTHKIRRKVKTRYNGNNNCCYFSDINISQGSVATHLRGGGTFYHIIYLLKND